MICIQYSSAKDPKQTYVALQKEYLLLIYLIKRHWPERTPELIISLQSTSFHFQIPSPLYFYPERERERKETRASERTKVMACSINFPVSGKSISQTSASLIPSPTKTLKLSTSVSPLPSIGFISGASLRLNETLKLRGSKKSSAVVTALAVPVIASVKPEPLKIMISGAPASGKGTQCELITKKYGLVHIAAGDLLRAEVAAGTENGKQAKEHMEKGQLVPDEIVVMMVKERLLQSDSQESGWLLDGYPRSLSQAKALEDFGIQPDLFILLEVPEEILVERVVGRRLDPVTGKIYHLKYSPPETEEIAARLTQRFDDTEEKVKLRLRTHHQNVEAVLSTYEGVTVKVNGNVPKEEVFAQIDGILTGLIKQKKAASDLAGVRHDSPSSEGTESLKQVAC